MVAASCGGGCGGEPKSRSGGARVAVTPRALPRLRIVGTQRDSWEQFAASDSSPSRGDDRNRVSPVRSEAEESGVVDVSDDQGLSDTERVAGLSEAEGVVAEVRMNAALREAFRSLDTVDLGVISARYATSTTVFTVTIPGAMRIAMQEVMSGVEQNDESVLPPPPHVAVPTPLLATISQESSWKRGSGCSPRRGVQQRLPQLRFDDAGIRRTPSNVEQNKPRVWC